MDLLQPITELGALLSTEKQADIQVATEPEASRFLPMVTFSVRLNSANRSSHDPVFGIIANISTTGACVITNRGLPNETVVEVSIASKELGETVILPARVIWCAERLEPVREIVGYLTGLAFHAESEEAIQNLLSSTLFQPVT